MKKNHSTLAMAILAIIFGCVANYLGDRIIGVRIELFWGLETFNFAWFIQIFILPVLVGFIVAWFFGLGGKWLAFIPPLIVRAIAYFETVEILGIPQGAELMPLGWWGFFVILAMETAGIGGIIGEVLFKRTYGRSTKEEKDMLSENTAKAKESSEP
jgi:hypothetical protein